MNRKIKPPPAEWINVQSVSVNSSHFNKKRCSDFYGHWQLPFSNLLLLVWARPYCKFTQSICALTRSINNKGDVSVYSPLNFCARVESVDDILVIASFVTFSMVLLELWDILCSMLLLQHDPAEGTSQYLSFTSGMRGERKAIKNWLKFSRCGVKIQSVDALFICHIEILMRFILALAFS